MHTLYPMLLHTAWNYDLNIPVKQSTGGLLSKTLIGMVTKAAIQAEEDEVEEKSMQ